MEKRIQDIKVVVKITLTEIGLYSSEAVDQIMGTGAQEGMGFTKKKQMGGGPALSYFQIEPVTHDDCWTNFLNYKKDLAQKILKVSGLSSSDVSQLEKNLIYSICMCRVVYLRKPGRIPNDLLSQAKYWKKYYNTEKGKGTVAEYIENYHRYIE